MTAKQEWVCGYRIDFSDGGESEMQVLHVGSREECERVKDMIPGVSYSGDRPNPRAWLVCGPLAASEST